MDNLSPKSETPAPLTENLEKEYLQNDSGTNTDKLGTNYDVRFPSPAIEKKFEKALECIPTEDQRRVAEALEKIGNDPFQKINKHKVLSMPIEIFNLIAHHRWQIGDFRIFYDVDQEQKIVWLLTIRRRNERTYK